MLAYVKRLYSPEAAVRNYWCECSNKAFIYTSVLLTWTQTILKSFFLIVHLTCASSIAVNFAPGDRKVDCNFYKDGSEVEEEWMLTSNTFIKIL